MNWASRVSSAGFLTMMSRYSSLAHLKPTVAAALAPNFQRSFSDQKPTSTAPSTSTLLKVDWLLQKITPLVLKSNVRDFMDICKDDVQFDDRIFSKKLGGRTQLMSHIAKVRMYYRYLSPFNKVEWIGSCVYENEDVIVVMWRLTTLDSSFMSYFPSFITKKENKMIVKEGALDVQIDREGHVLRIVNRPITASDREGAKSLAKMKEEQHQEYVQAEEKEMRKEFDRQYHS